MEIEANLCFCILGKNFKIQNGRQNAKIQNSRHFWEVKAITINNNTKQAIDSI